MGFGGQDRGQGPGAMGGMMMGGGRGRGAGRGNMLEGKRIRITKGFDKGKIGTVKEESEVRACGMHESCLTVKYMSHVALLKRSLRCVRVAYMSHVSYI